MSLEIPSQAGDLALASMLQTETGQIRTQEGAGAGKTLNDSVSLSHEARLLMEAKREAQAAPDVRQDKIEALRSQVQSGTYQIDSRKIAEHMLIEEPGLFS